MKKILLSIVAVLIPLHAYSFNWSKCRRNTFDRPDTGARTFLSTSQFTSSTGACAAIGIKESVRKEYYAVNFDQIKADAAKGDGEYITTLLSISQCTNRDGHRLKIYLKYYFEDYFNLNAKKSYQQLIPVFEKGCGKKKYG